MGIKGFINIKKNFNSTVKINIEKFAGKRIAIDVSGLIYKYVIAKRSGGNEERNSNGIIVSHLSNLMIELINFIQCDITPVVVFDGPESNLKSKTRKKRRETKELAIDKMKKIKNKSSDEYMKMSSQTYSPSSNEICILQEMLIYMGIPFINSKVEADLICAWLSCYGPANSNEPYVFAVYSIDSDITVFGTEYRFSKFNKKSQYVKCISKSKLLNEMDLTENEFVNLCAFMGNDYCDNIKNIGYVKCLDGIKNYGGTVESAIESEGFRSKYKIEHKSVPKSIINARDFYLNEIHKGDFSVTDYELNMMECQVDRLFKFITDNNLPSYLNKIIMISKLVNEKVSNNVDDDEIVDQWERNTLMGKKERN